MRYIGGKSKLARFLTEAILADTERRGKLIEPFCGGASMTAALAPHFEETVASDVVGDLILMWDAVSKGWTPPESITEEEYAALKTAEPSPLRAFAGFGGSFGGKWFAGYARGGKTAAGVPRNHQGESARAVTRIGKIAQEHGVTFLHRGYDEVEIDGTEVIYCDPPYREVFGYAAAGSFDSDRFYEIVEGWARKGAEVYVSEYTAPEHWKLLAERGHRRSLDTVATRIPTQERLFKVVPAAQ